MRLSTFALAASITPALASWIPSAGELIQDVDQYIHSSIASSSNAQLELADSSLLSVQRGSFGGKGKKCTLKSGGEGADDTENFLKTVKECGHGGVLHLPDPVYTITRPLTITLEDSVLDLHGFLTFTNTIEYWIENRIVFDFQNQSLAFVINGNNFVLDGNDVGGIDGNGQQWYDCARDFGNKFGRPMSLAISDAKDVEVKRWTVKQPQFWALILIRTENVAMKDIYINATSYNPESWSDNKSWLQNTDGLDTYISHNVSVENFVYQGGDDCIALKPNSTSIYMRNITCWGGTGIALGSIAQYEGVTDIIEDVVMEDINLFASDQCLGYQGVYAKSWIGESHGTPPNGGGGGNGYAKNITFKNVYMKDIIHPIAVDTTLTYLPDVKGKPDIKGSLFEWSDIVFDNFTGTATGNRVVWMDCPKHLPCHDFTFRNVDIKPGKTDHPEISFVCNNIVMDGQDGLQQCHPSNSTLEMDNDGTL